MTKLNGTQVVAVFVSFLDPAVRGTFEALFVLESLSGPSYYLIEFIENFCVESTTEPCIGLIGNRLLLWLPPLKAFRLADPWYEVFDLAGDTPCRPLDVALSP